MSRSNLPHNPSPTSTDLATPSYVEDLRASLGSLGLRANLSRAEAVKWASERWWCSATASLAPEPNDISSRCPTCRAVLSDWTVTEDGDPSYCVVCDREIVPIPPVNAVASLTVVDASGAVFVGYGHSEAQPLTKSVWWKAAADLLRQEPGACLDRRRI